MRHFFTIISHEIRMLLVSPGTYVAAVLFLLVMGSLFADLLESYSQIAQEESPAKVFFADYFWIPVFFMVPLLTMKSISEERRLGTLETLLTAPVSTAEVVLGKYGAAYFLYMALWALTAGFFYIMYRFAGDTHFLDPGPLIGSYLFIAVSGLFFVAIGIFASSLSRNQAFAGMMSFSMLFALILGLHLLQGLEAVNNSPALSPLKTVVNYAQSIDHLADFSRGVIDTREILFYISGTVLALTFSILSVEAKLLHS
jgi:ABC-2 type transport system permease protein